MRRHAGIAAVGWIVIAAVTMGAACSRTWVLPGDAGAGGGSGPPADGSVGETGGASGRGGAPAPGGQNQPGTGGMGGQPGVACKQETASARLMTTDFIFVVGRTTSMSARLGEGTRMSTVQAALRSLITSNQNAVNFGYAEFPSFDGCSNGTSCCPSLMNLVTSEPKNWFAIDEALNDCGGSAQGGCVAQTDSRPIAPTLNIVPNLWGSQPFDPIIVLIVDGPPSCPFEDLGQSCQAAKDAVTQLSLYVKTFVVALGQDAQNDMCLRNIAMRGGTGSPIVLSDTAPDPISMLTASLAPIVTAAAPASCTIALTSKPSQMNMDKVAVYIREREIPFDSSGKDGWKFVDGSNIQIQVRGSWCPKLQNARQNDLSVRFGCAPCGEAYPCP